MRIEIGEIFEAIRRLILSKDFDSYFFWNFDKLYFDNCIIVHLNINRILLSVFAFVQFLSFKLTFN